MNPQDQKKKLQVQEKNIIYKQDTTSSKQQQQYSVQPNQIVAPKNINTQSEYEREVQLMKYMYKKNQEQQGQPIQKIPQLSQQQLQQKQQLQQIQMFQQVQQLQQIEQEQKRKQKQLLQQAPNKQQMQQIQQMSSSKNQTSSSIYQQICQSQRMNQQTKQNVLIQKTIQTPQKLIDIQKKKRVEYQTESDDTCEDVKEDYDEINQNKDEANGFEEDEDDDDENEYKSDDDGCDVEIYQNAKTDLKMYKYHKKGMIQKDYNQWNNINEQLKQFNNFYDQQQLVQALHDQKFTRITQEFSFSKHKQRMPCFTKFRGSQMQIENQNEKIENDPEVDAIIKDLQQEIKYMERMETIKGNKKDFTSISSPQSDPNSSYQKEDNNNSSSSFESPYNGISDKHNDNKNKEINNSIIMKNLKNNDFINNVGYINDEANYIDESDQMVIENDDNQKKKKQQYNMATQQHKELYLLYCVNGIDPETACDLVGVTIKCAKRWIFNLSPERLKGGGRKIIDGKLEQKLRLWILMRLYDELKVPSREKQILYSLGNVRNQNFKCSKGWLEKYLDRNGLKHIINHLRSLEIFKFQDAVNFFVVVPSTNSEKMHQEIQLIQNIRAKLKEDEENEKNNLKETISSNKMINSEAKQDNTNSKLPSPPKSLFERFISQIKENPNNNPASNLPYPSINNQLYSSNNQQINSAFLGQNNNLKYQNSADIEINQINQVQNDKIKSFNQTQVQQQQKQFKPFDLKNHKQLLERGNTMRKLALSKQSTQQQNQNDQPDIIRNENNQSMDIEEKKRNTSQTNIGPVTQNKGKLLTKKQQKIEEMDMHIDTKKPLPKHVREILKESVLLSRNERMILQKKGLKESVNQIVFEIETDHFLEVCVKELNLKLELLVKIFRFQY